MADYKSFIVTNRASPPNLSGKGPLVDANWIPPEAGTSMYINLHGSYRYVPQILREISRTLNGLEPPG